MTAYILETAALHRRLRNWPICELQVETALYRFTTAIRFLCAGCHFDQDSAWLRIHGNNWDFVRDGLA